MRRTGSLREVASPTRPKNNKIRLYALAEGIIAEEAKRSPPHKVG